MQLQNHDLVIAFVRDYGANQQQGRTHATRKAPCTTIALLAAFEIAIMSEQMTKYDRMHAWHRCVRSWSAQRFDDHKGVGPALMRLLSTGLRAT